MKIAGLCIMALGLGMILFSFFQGSLTGALPAENLQDQMDQLEYQRGLGLVQLLGSLFFIAGALFACTGFIVDNANRR